MITFGSSLVAVVASLALQGGAPGSAIWIRVTDASTGQPVPSATVTLTDLQRTCLTSADGECRFGGVPAGPQHVTVRRFAFAPRVLHALVGPATPVVLTIALAPVPRTLSEVRIEEPTVAAISPADATGERVGPIDRTVDLSSMRGNPRLAEPDVLLALVGGEVAASPELPDGLHVRGSSASGVAYTIDGIPVLGPFHAGGTFGALIPDAFSRLSLRSEPASVIDPLATGGVVAATTRPVPDRVQAAGGIAASQASLTLEAPFARRGVGGEGAGLLVSGRWLFPGLLGQKPDPSQIDGDARDGLLRLAFPLRDGVLRVIRAGHGSDASIAAVAPEGNATGAEPLPRSELLWGGASSGITWHTAGDPRQIALRAWRATGRTDVDWRADTLPIGVASRITDLGASAEVVQPSAGGEWTLSARVQRLESRHRATTTGGALGGLALGSRETLLAAAVARRQAIGPGLEVTGTSRVSHFDHSWRLAPSVTVAWRLARPVTLALSVGRQHQFTQDLGNPESIVRNVFPATMSVVASDGVPVPQSDELVLVFEARPGSSVLVSARGWTRRERDLAMPAIGRDEVFATSAVAAGSLQSHGVAVEATITSARAALSGSVLWQRVRASALDSTWIPAYGATRSLEVGAIVYPDASSSLRASLSGGSGRRATGFAGALEWESCNLRDRGCEFAGAPLRRDGALGALELPDYVRLDIGARKHWHVVIGGRDAVVSAFATYSNVLDRSNVLTIGNDPVGGARVVGMRPGSPFVVGIDWRF